MVQPAIAMLFHAPPALMSRLRGALETYLRRSTLGTAAGIA